MTAGPFPLRSAFRVHISGGFLALFFVGLIIISAGCGGSTSISSTPPPRPVQVTISPTSATVQSGATQQFNAMVTGYSNTAATWSVNEIVGGNSTLGTISASGLYTAPAVVPSPNTVTLKATSVADTTKSA